MAEYFALVKQIDFEYLYSVSKWFLTGSAFVGPVTFVYDAPFGRFSTPDSVLSIDGTKAWIVMELVSPLVFLITTYLHPFSATHLPFPSLARGASPQFILVVLYLIHYLNRALIPPAVVSAGIIFNVPNGFLLASFLTSASTASYLTGAFTSTRFWAGIALWAVGFAGNVYHDEILLNIRRKAIAKGKARELDGDEKKTQRPHYAIPHGGMYSLISFPNYFCEWIEWIGFALAAGPLPSFTLLPMPSLLRLRAARPVRGLDDPPWVFLLVEITAMVPRAVRGHRWYHERFKDSYPAKGVRSFHGYCIRPHSPNIRNEHT
ncbi:3-oxo-5-alpha-steroid 4-dehydrogenase-domain-containing protein [Lactarius quietus]|nr:3-oxo-5-alpha-steroid 4-dehydrogenase-domain-containing protein [Lactarius quietus]